MNASEAYNMVLLPVMLGLFGGVNKLNKLVNGAGKNAKYEYK